MSAALPGYEVESWANNYPELGNAVGRKNIVMDIFSVIIVMIAGIGILNLLMMAIYERTREIGLLGAMGLKPGQIATTFILEGALIGVVGVIAGIAMGLAINLSLMQVGMDYSSVCGRHGLYGFDQRAGLSHIGRKQVIHARHDHARDRRTGCAHPGRDRFKARAV